MRDVFKERKADKSVPQKITSRNRACKFFWFCLELNIET